MIKEHEIDRETSIYVSKECGDSLELKRCYNNIYDTIRYFGDEFYGDKWKIAYGYVTAVEGILARHAFIVNENNQAIDPTLAMSKHFLDGEPKMYISFKIFDTLSDYVDTLVAHDNNPDLYRAFVNEEDEARTWANERNLLLYT